MDLKEAYAVLEVAPGSKAVEVKAAYRLLASVWHPDRLAGSEKMKAAGAAKMLRINEAFRTIQAAGFPPEAAPPRAPPRPRPAEEANREHAQKPHSTPSQPRPGPSDAESKPPWWKNPELGCHLGCAMALVVLLVVLIVAGLTGGVHVTWRFGTPP